MFFFYLSINSLLCVVHLTAADNDCRNKIGQPLSLHTAFREPVTVNSIADSPTHTRDSLVVRQCARMGCAGNKPLAQTPRRHTVIL